MLSKQTLLFLFPFFQHIWSTNAALLLFSSRDVEIPALETFRDEHLTILLEELNRPKVFAFQVNSASAIEYFHKNRFSGNSAYVPSEELKLKYNATGTNCMCKSLTRFDLLYQFQYSTELLNKILR